MQAVTITQISPPELEILIENTIRKVLSVHTEPQPEQDAWFNIDELCEYLPAKPAKATIYGKVHQRLIPFHKQGKSLIFRKSDIDEWLTRGRIKTIAETAEEASHYLRRKG
jgi:excisionase family DNA binding protein